MEFSIATLLANFTDDKLVARKVLEKKLGCEDELSLHKLHIALEVLEKIGILVKERGKYRRINEEGLIEAKLRCSSKGFCFAIQEVEGSEDIYVRESHLSNAWNGDRVLVKVLKEGSRRRSPEGEVKLILERANQSLLARIKQANSKYRAVPLDDRLLFELDIKENGNQLDEAIDHLAHVEVLRYPLAQYPPVGQVVQILGSDAEAAADIDLVTCKHDLSRNFPEAVREYSLHLPSKISKPELKKRLDLRNLFTITIATDRADCQETALSLEKTPAGQWQLGVHITDVAYYVEPDEALDREACKRGRSVYLGETVLPMLPESVQQLCSLIPRKERLTLSLLITLDPSSGQVVEFDLQPAAIQVDQQLSTADVAAIVANPDDSPLPDEVVAIVQQLSALSQSIKAQRYARGSFELNLPPSQDFFCDEGMLGAVIVNDYPGVEAELSPSIGQALLTELLILTNQLIASHLVALGVPAIYRVQAAPDPEDTQDMMKLAQNLGVELELREEEQVQPLDYQEFTKIFANSDSQQVLTYLLQETLKPASYSTKVQPHFGLALGQGYTHAHAPLRRYPDLQIQRILHAVFEQGRDRRTTRAKERVNLHHSSCHGQITWNVLPPDLQEEIEGDLARVIVQINDREKDVQEAEADLAGLQRASLMKQRIGEVFNGVITGVQSYGFFVEIEVSPADGRLLRVEGLVHVSSLKDDWYEYRARQQALFGRKNRAAYRLGDRVAVQVKSVDYYRQQIDLVTVGNDGFGDIKAVRNGEPADYYLDNDLEDNDLEDNDLEDNDLEDDYGDDD